MRWWWIKQFDFHKKLEKVISEKIITVKIMVEI